MRFMALLFACLASTVHGRRTHKSSERVQIVKSAAPSFQSVAESYEGSSDAASSLSNLLKDSARLLLAFNMVLGLHTVDAGRVSNLASSKPTLENLHDSWRSRMRDISMQADDGDPRAQLFQSLLSGSGVSDSVKISSSPDGYRLVTTRPVNVGETLLTIPRELLITAHRSGVIGGLQGQTDAMWNAAGDLRDEVGEVMFAKGATWDVRLALGVFDACGGAGGDFWDAYRQLLPTPPLVTHLLTLPDAWLPEVQDEKLQARAVELREKLMVLYPELDSHAAHPATSGYEAMGAPMEQVPKPLQYTYALVVSRCFAMSDGDTFAFVPFLDMANHEAGPTANFGSDASKFVLQALQPLNEGDEVSVCYGEDYTTQRLFEQYGFAPEQGTAQDWRLLQALVDEAAAAGDSATVAALANAPKTPLGESLAGMQSFAKALANQSKNVLYTRERAAAILYAVGVLDDEEEKGGASGGYGYAGISKTVSTSSKAVSPTALLAALRWRLASFPTTLDEDEEQLQQISDTAGKQRVDPRLTAIFGYRIALKRLFTLTEVVLRTFLGT